MTNVVPKEKVYKDDRMDAKILLLILNAKFNGCILQIHPMQNKRQRSMNEYWCCKSSIYKATWSLLYTSRALAACLGKWERDTLHAPSRQ